MNKENRKFSLLRITIVLAVIFLAAFLVYEIVKYYELKKVQSQIHSELSTANLLIVANSDVASGKAIFKFIQDEDELINISRDEIKSLIRIKSQADISKIISSLVLNKKEDREDCRCNGSHYLGFYHDKELLGIILVKHAKFVKYIDKKDKYSGKYCINESDMAEIVKLLKEYKIDLKQND